MTIACTEAPVMERVTLDANDRCDTRACGAQAYVMTQHANGGQLLWCGHHLHENELALFADGATIVIDCRNQLSPQPPEPVPA